MKKAKSEIRLVLLVVALALLLQPWLAGAETTNLWPNPGFEEDANGDALPDFWIREGTDPSIAKWDTNVVFSGKRSLFLEDNDPNARAQWVSSHFPLTGGETYLLQFYVKFDVEAWAMQLALQCFNDSGILVDNDRELFTGTQNEWVQITMVYFVPPEAASIRVLFLSHGTDAALGKAWIDEITLFRLERESLISKWDHWRYLDDGLYPGTNWTDVQFADWTWPMGPAKLGYGDPDVATEVSFGPDPDNKYITTYFRRMFFLQDPASVTNLTLFLRRDDGAIVYLNGVELVRNNMPVDEPVNHLTLASTTVGSSAESVYLEFPLGSAGMLEGTNVVSVEIHQAARNSSDIGFDLHLHGNFPDLNGPPQLQWDYPDEGASFVMPAEIPMSVSITNDVVAVKVVEFFDGDTRLATVTAPPYSFVWTNAPYGEHALKAVVTDYSDRVTETEVAVVSVDRGVVLPLIEAGSTWKYLDDGSDQGTNWIRADFDDHAWASGPAELGYGDGDEGTRVSFGPESRNKYATTYFRHSFNVVDVDALMNLVVRLRRDDGAIVYVNAVEVFRSNMPTNGVIDYETLALETVSYSNESNYFKARLEPETLRNGTNIVAVEVHQWSRELSSDISFDLEMGVEAEDGTPTLVVDGDSTRRRRYVGTNSAVIELESSFQGATILYSLDGTAPATLYAGPFSIDQSASIRAIAYDATFLNFSSSGPFIVDVFPGRNLSAVSRGGGIVGADPSAEIYIDGQQVELMAIADPGWEFLTWLGDVGGGMSVTDLNISGDACIEALFGTRVGTTAAGLGTVHSNPEVSLVPFGTEISLTAVPNPGAYLAFWGGSISATNNPIEVVITNPMPNYAAVFSLLPSGQYSVTAMGQGAGGAGVIPWKPYYAEGEQVMVRALPHPGQAFLGWDDGSEDAERVFEVRSNTILTAMFTSWGRLEFVSCDMTYGADTSRLQLTGRLGEVYRIERSIDLVEWIPHEVVTNHHGVMQLDLPVSPIEAREFYRAQGDGMP